MQLLAHGRADGHTFLLYAPSPEELIRSCEKHGLKLAIQLTAGEKAAADKFFRMRQFNFILEIKRKAINAKNA